MNTIAVVVLLVLLDESRLYHSQNINIDFNKEWQQFVSLFGKKYQDQAQELYRRRIWETNLKFIQKHNLEYFLGLKSYSLGINKFSDMTHKEFMSVYLPANITTTETTNITTTETISTTTTFLKSSAIPGGVDWRQKGAVTPVKDQGQCGSCWAFSVVGAIEGQYYKITNGSFRFSDQQLLDCSTNNNGCDGGHPYLAYVYIYRAPGIQLESDYPYTAKQATCKFDKSKAIAEIYAYKKITQDENSLANAVATDGPVSTAIDSSRPSFQHYKSGIYDEPSCSSSVVNHAVLIVGYGVSDSGQQYWIVKNSWGTGWGQSGYILMSKNKNNQCGITSMPSVPLIRAKVILKNGNGTSLSMGVPEEVNIKSGGQSLDHYTFALCRWTISVLFLAPLVDSIF